jgi:3-dehydroquinate synthetase
MPMRWMNLEFEGDRYPVGVGADCLDEIIAGLVALDASSFHVVTDRNVQRLHATRLFEKLSGVAQARLWPIAEGEAFKTMSTVERLAQDMVTDRIDRRSVVIAMGGGVVGNLAGLLSALLYRGIRLVHVPTTLIAMGDSVASMKQAVNLPQGKNLLGCFHKPTAVFADVHYLSTLPASEIRSGMCEIIKNALTVDAANLGMLQRTLVPDARYSGAVLAEIVEAGLLAKQKVMVNDKCERREAIVFEYGHTVGHAIELAAKGRLSHGEAVGLGMIVAAEIACELGLLSADVRDLHYSLVRKNGVSIRLPQGVDTSDVMALVRNDNKRGYLNAAQDQIAMILLRGLQQPAGDTARPLTLVDASLVEAVVDRCLGMRGIDMRKEKVA